MKRITGIIFSVVFLVSGCYHSVHEKCHYVEIKGNFTLPLEHGWFNPPANNVSIIFLECDSHGKPYRPSYLYVEQYYGELIFTSDFLGHGTTNSDGNLDCYIDVDHFANHDHNFTLGAVAPHPDGSSVIALDLTYGIDSPPVLRAFSWSKPINLNDNLGRITVNGWH